MSAAMTEPTARRRFVDAATGLTVVQVFQGDCYLTNAPSEMLSTILGSCVSACVRDPVTGWGGMNHFFLPDGDQAKAKEVASVALRYGSFAMEQLINGILSRGGRRDRLEVKVFGGANVLRGVWGVGHVNAGFVERYLANEGLAIAAADLRGTSPRRVQYFPVTGRVRVKELQGRDQPQDVRLFEPARPMRSRAGAGGSIELFD